MGYAHNWQFKKEGVLLDEVLLGRIKKVLGRYKDVIKGEGENADVIVSPELIQFNGIGFEGEHEPFTVDPNWMDNSCKTNRKPYDLAVCEVLLVLGYYCSDFEFGSDGLWVSEEEALSEKLDGNWDQALVNMEDMFGIQYNRELEIHNEWGRMYYKIALHPTRDGVKKGSEERKIRTISINF